MRVRLKMQISGTRSVGEWPEPGGELDVSDAEGADLCASGIAEPVAVKPAEERAVVTPPPAEERAEVTPATVTASAQADAQTSDEDASTAATGSASLPRGPSPARPTRR